jgi:hypothetical protein
VVITAAERLFDLGRVHELIERDYALGFLRNGRDTSQQGPGKKQNGASIP